MELSTAIALIRKGIPDNRLPQRWVDLGAGSGLFTQALAQCLPASSTITAMDRDQKFTVPHTVNDVFIEHQTSDFVEDDLPGNLDGVLMANALHFVRDKAVFFEKLGHSLKPEGRLIIVEYNMNKANPWVPFPITYQALSSDFQTFFSVVEQIGHADSLYQRSGMYSARLTFRTGVDKV